MLCSRPNVFLFHSFELVQFASREFELLTFDITYAGSLASLTGPLQCGKDQFLATLLGEESRNSPGPATLLQGSALQQRLEKAISELINYASSSKARSFPEAS
jgi:hypothetical protein